MLKQTETAVATADQEDYLAEWLSSSAAKSSKGASVESVVKIPGDASTRQYFRVTMNGKAQPSSFILARVEPFADQRESYPFLIVRDHLEASGVDVPKVFNSDPDAGFVLLEDLGDDTLLRRLQDVSNSDVERHLYEKVIDSLITMQLEASPLPGRKKDLEAFKLRFDHEKLMWEVNFAIEHFYKIYLKRDIAASDLKIMTEGFSEICHFLAAQPTVLTHRDFHSRNVMAKGDRLVMIDFQDARMGPAQYDLASLLRDSYYQLEEAQIVRLLDYYVVSLEARTGKAIDREKFHYVFDMMAVQRNFKAIGSFASFLNRRGNATYLKYIGNTFENIRRTLLKYPKYSKLRETLFHYYYF